jgi:hypothetical protein
MKQGMDVESNVLASTAELARELASANHFTAWELERNRAGRIAPSQVRRLWSVALDPVRTSLYALLGWLLFVTGLLAFMPLKLFAMWEWEAGMSLWFLFGAITVTTTFSFLYQLFGSFGRVAGLVQDIVAGVAVAMEGRVSTSSTNQKVHGMGEVYGETEDRFSYVIEEEYLPVDEAAYHALQPYSGSFFRLFVTPQSKLLLSIEPVKIRRTDRMVK